MPVVGHGQPIAPYPQIHGHATTYPPNYVPAHNAGPSTGHVDHQTQIALVPVIPRPVPHDPSKVFRVPLPPDTSTFCDPITIMGVPGLRCRDCLNIRKSLANRHIVTTVDNVGQPMDGLFTNKEAYIHRGWWVCDVHPKNLFTTKTHKDPEEDYKFGHLLTMLVDKVYKAWHSGKFADADNARDLQDLVGPQVAPTPGVRVRYDMVYIVAVRRWKDRRGRYHYFPELEIRI
ncbi:hypothetical protein C8Q79DRAFT_451931 [Trametes meyenii]|nr:hypothetical protein C8Q79DRAFT_451931 [Trametes meyenii]